MRALAAAVVLAVTPAAALPWAGGPARARHVAAAIHAGATPAPARPRLHGARDLDGKQAQRPRGLVAFTFDDGPHRDTTPRALAALAAYDAPAAFFVNGYRFDSDASAAERANAGALAAAAAAGHLIGNHTFGHVRLDDAGRLAAFVEIWRNQRAIFRVTGARGTTPRLFRPPYGKLSPAAAALLEDLGFTVVRWSIDAEDWNATDAAAVRERVVAAILAADGGVVLLHDSMPATVKALPGILADLQAESCRRLRAGREPIIPVSLDFFAFDASGAPIAPDPAAIAWKDRTRAAIVSRCGVDKVRQGD